MNPIPEGSTWTEAVSFLPKFKMMNPVNRELLFFLRHAHDGFRPRQGGSVFTSGEGYLQNHMREGFTLVSRMRSMMTMLVEDKDFVLLPSASAVSDRLRIASKTEPSPTYSSNFYRDLNHLFTLFTFVARDFNSTSVEAELAAMQSPDQTQVLSRILTARERWKPADLHPGEAVAILGPSLPLHSIGSTRHLVSYTRSHLPGSTKPS